MLSLFNTDIITNRIDKLSFSHGELIVTNKIHENPRSITLDLYAMSGERVLVTLFTEISNNIITIVDFISRQENNGNGTKMFGVLIDYICLINSEYHIERIHGYLSRFDYNHWEKLIHFYTHLSDVINNSRSNIKLSFKLQDHELSEFIDNMKKYSGNDIYFDYYITYP